MAAGGDTETSPLLTPRDATSSPQKHSRSFIIVWMIFLIVLIDFAAFLALPSQNVLFEKIICEQYVASLRDASEGRSPLPENPCKSNAVQSELGDILGWIETFQMMPGILVGLPWGMLGDRWGRRPILFLSLVGITVCELAMRAIVYWPEIFPLRAVWYIQLLLIPMGGGATVGQSMVFTIITDITEPSERADLFAILLFSVLASEIIATPIGGAFAEAGHPWIPYIASPILIGISGILVWVLPETLPPQDKHAFLAEEEDLLSGKSHITRRLRNLFRESILPRIRAVPQFLWKNLLLVCLMAVGFATVLSRQSNTFIVLFASKNFSWSIAQASYLLSLCSAANLFVLMVVVPGMSRLLMNRLGYSAPWKDLILLRSQSFILIVGATLVAISNSPPTLVIGLIALAFGAGLSVSLRSLATMLVPQKHFASLNSALAISQALGCVTAGPLLAAAWKRGLRLGGAWLGLPFFMVAALFAVVAAVTWAIRLKEEIVSERSECANDDMEQEA